MIYLAYRVFETCDGHSGYEFPFSPCRMIPLGGGANFHSYHHLVNVGNYGSAFIIWDLIFGTSKEYFDMLESELEGKPKGTVTKIKRME